MDLRRVAGVKKCGRGRDRGDWDRLAHGKGENRGYKVQGVSCWPKARWLYHQWLSYPQYCGVPPQSMLIGSIDLPHHLKQYLRSPLENGWVSTQIYPLPQSCLGSLSNFFYPSRKNLSSYQGIIVKYTKMSIISIL